MTGEWAEAAGNSLQCHLHVTCLRFPRHTPCSSAASTHYLLSECRLSPRPWEERPHGSRAPGVRGTRAAWPRPGRGRGGRR